MSVARTALPPPRDVRPFSQGGPSTVARRVFGLLLELALLLASARLSTDQRRGFAGFLSLWEAWMTMKVSGDTSVIPRRLEAPSKRCTSFGTGLGTEGSSSWSSGRSKRVRRSLPLVWTAIFSIHVPVGY